LAGLEPRRVFEIFETLSGVPHGSGNTKQVSDLCLSLMRERGLYAVQDGFNNVIIKKPASPGYEDRPPVLLQAHLDMVCTKDPDYDIDMSRDPIKLVTDGKEVWADRTSLGADDMIGVACALALLDDPDAVHPPLEILLTVDEETGMDGAAGFDPALISARRMINLDSEEEGVITAGCAGGLMMAGLLSLQRRRISAASRFYRIEVSGLLGGHSGAEIDRERGNSNLIAARMLYELIEFSPRLVSFSGGTFDNVIPSKTEMTAAVPAQVREDELLATFEKVSAGIKKEYRASEPGLRITIEAAPASVSAVTEIDTWRVAATLFLLPNGVMHMNIELPGLVETSLSCGIVRLEGSALRFRTFIRSSSEERKQALAERVKLTAALYGGTTTREGDFPAWQYNGASPLLYAVREAWRRYSGRDAKVFATHGGLECGILTDKLEGLDCVSIGPELHDIHSVNERLSVASVQRLYGFLKEILKSL